MPVRSRYSFLLKLMVMFFYSHHTVQSVSTSEWYVKLSIASWRNLKFATWRIAKFEHMHGLQKCTLPIFIQAVRLLQTGWFQNQPTGSSMQTGPDRSCRASSLPWVEVQWASLHNFVVVLFKIDNQEEQFSRLSPDQRKMEEKKEVDWIIFVFSRHLSVSHLDASQLGEVVWKWRWHFSAPPGPLGDKRPCHQTAVVTFPIRAYSHLLWQHSDSDPQNGNVDISFPRLCFKPMCPKGSGSYIKCGSLCAFYMCIVEQSG